MIAEEFETDLRTVVHMQARLIERLKHAADAADERLAHTSENATTLRELEALMDKLEDGSEHLRAEDLDDYDPDAIPALYERRRRGVQRELAKIGYRDWNHFVRQCRAHAFAEGVDPLAPYDVLLTDEDYEQLERELFDEQLKWDQTDYLFVFGSGILAALTDYFLVGIPQTLRTGQYAGQEGSPLTSWLKQYDTTAGGSEGWFADFAQGLEARCKTPYDRLDLEGMYPKSHRLQALGHSPIMGFLFGVLDILRGTISGFSYDHLAGTHEWVVRESSFAERAPGLVEAILRHIGHLVSDVATPMGLPAPLMSLFQGINAGSFGEKGRSVGQLTRWMYTNGYDLRHFLVSGLTPATIEIVLRGYLMLRHYAEHGETKFRVASDPKYRSMLLTAHSVAAAGNAGKVALMQGNPLAINQAQWMAFLRYLLPHAKHWLFDKHRLRIEHMDRIAEKEWDDLLDNSRFVMEKAAREDEIDLVTVGSVESS